MQGVAAMHSIYLNRLVLKTLASPASLLPVTGELLLPPAPLLLPAGAPATQRVTVCSLCSCPSHPAGQTEGRGHRLTLALERTRSVPQGLGPKRSSLAQVS